MGRGAAKSVPKRTSLRGRKRRVEDDDKVNHERWLISYSDMITVLMGLFIVLFAMSQLDQAKFQALAQSLLSGFTGTQASILDGTTEINTGQLEAVDAEAIIPDLASPATPPSISPTFDPMDLAQSEVDWMRQVRQQILAALAAKGLDGTVAFAITNRGLVMTLVDADLFFEANSADLTPKAREVLDAVSIAARERTEAITIEGNANVIPAGGPYKSNWELSTARATEVVHWFIDNGGIAPTRLTPIGHGDTRPLIAGTSNEALATNRRVDIVINSDAPEAVRDLFTQIDSGAADVNTAGPGR
jgi:chemotaxis protein MotB